MNQIRNYDRQMWTVQNFMITPDSCYEVVKFDCTEITGTHHVMIAREYKRKDINFSYVECVSIGPRGGVKEVYKHIV